MKNIFVIFCCILLTKLVLGQSGSQGREVFQVLDGSKRFSTIQDIIHFKPSDYTSAPWNFVMSDLLDGGDFLKSASFWVRHNFTTPPFSQVILVRAASTISKAPVIATDAHFLVYLESSGANIQLKLRYLVNGNTVLTETLVSGINLSPYIWYGVFISRTSKTDDRGVLFVYNPSTIVASSYQTDLQTVISTSPSGYQKAGATSNFYIDIGGDLQISSPSTCEIANFNFLYKQSYFSAAATILELIKQPPRLLLWLEYTERDTTLQLVKDLSNENNVVFRGDSQFDITRDTQLNYDQTVNGDVGHLYGQNSFDTIFPAFDLGREYAISFWIRFDQRPAAVTVDAFQPVLFKQNTQNPKMQIYVAFEATSTTITKLQIKSGATLKQEPLVAAVSRTDGKWYYFYVYFANFLKNETASGTFHPTTLYSIHYTKADGTMAPTIGGILDDYYIHGGTNDIMRIGAGVDGQNENLYGLIKRLQIFSGGWAFDISSDACLFALGGDRTIHITDGLLSSRIFCQTCSSSNSLSDHDCLGTCAAGTYQVSSDVNYDHCETCYENCQACTGRREQMCSSCFYGNWDPFGLLNCPGKNPCNIHQYQVGPVCQECKNECGSCKTSTTCSACQQGYSYNQATNQCQVATCGDGVVVAGEQCDDGNQFDGDGCTIDCIVETGWYCSFTGGPCYTICGDNVRASSEQCDDGNNINGDGCDYKCQLEDGYFCTVPANIGPFTNPSYKETCAICDNSFCKTCATASTCAKCISGKFLDATTCVSSCTLGYYQDTTTQTCQVCPNLCSLCTDATHCTQCSGTAALYNDLCLDTCPDGTYNGIDSGSGLRKCLSCPSHCITCSSSTSCYTCETSYYLQNPGATPGLCLPCDSTCQTCRGPNSNDCVLCSGGLTLQRSTSTCIILTCTSNQFANYDIGECQNCDPSCLTCINTLDTGCLTCNSTTALSVSNRCLNCTTQNGFDQSATDPCTEVCGDGKRVRKTTGCDDGNLEDGDGCSSTCVVESGWSCSGGSETTPDVCISYVGPKPIVTVNPKDPTFFEISFDKKVINTLQDKEFLTQIVVNLEGVNPESSQYQVFWDADLQIFTVLFDLKEDVIDSLMSVEFRSPARITDKFKNPVSPALTEFNYPRYYYVDKDTKNTASGLSTFSIVIQSINTVTIVPLAMTGYLNHYWIFLEFFQIINRLSLINVRTPYIAKEVFRSFRFLTLDWLPNAPNASSISFDRSKQAGRDKFDELQINTFFLENNGYQLTTWAFLIGLCLFLKIIIRIGIKKSLLKKLVFNAQINLEWSIVIRGIIEMYFNFAIFTFLQLTNLSTSEGILTFSSIMAIIGVVFLAVFPIFCVIRVLLVRNQYLLEIDIKFDTLYREFRKRHVPSLIFMFFILLQKTVIAAFLVGLQSVPGAQIALLAAEQILMLTILLIIRPYADGSLNFRTIIQEFALFAIFALFYGLLNENTDEDVRNRVGKVIIALVLATLLMHMIFLIKDAYYAIKEHIKNPPNFKPIFGKVKINPNNGEEEFQLNQDAHLNSSERIELPRSKESFSAQIIRETPQGTLRIKEEPKVIEKEESLFKFGDEEIYNNAKKDANN